MTTYDPAADTTLFLVNLGTPDEPTAPAVSRFLREFLYFGIKEARACLFVVLFFAAVFTVPREGLFGIARYDVLLVARPTAVLDLYGMADHRPAWINKAPCLTQTRCGGERLLDQQRGAGQPC